MYLLFVLLLGYFVVGELSVSIIQDRCWKREDQTTPGIPIGTTLCDNPTYTEVDDSTNYEQIGGSVSNSWNSIRTAHNYAFPQNCSMLAVDACVDFYCSNTNICNGTLVTRNEGGAWSTSFGTCPASDQGTICYDVTAAVSWAADCSDFQNNQSEILIDLLTLGKKTMYVDYIAYRVNYTTNPNLTNPVIIPFPAYNNDTLNCSTNVIDAEETTLYVNFTWYQNGAQVTAYDAQRTCANNTQCFTSVLVPSADLSIGDNWTCSAIVYDGFTLSTWKNSTMLSVLNRDPFINNVTINNNESINLLAAQNRTVECNGTVTEYDGFRDITNINATFYSSGTGARENDPDNSTNHYTNISCSFTNNLGSEQFYSCTFPVSYNAVNGTWTCRVNIIDRNGSTNTLQSTININPLVAIELSPQIADFGNVPINQISPDVPISVINYGNMMLDLELYAYALVDTDGLAMDCTTGNIDTTNERLNLTSGINFFSMTPVGNKTDPNILDFNLVPSNGAGSQKDIFWKLRSPQFTGGLCEGKVVFTATIS